MRIKKKIILFNYGGGMRGLVPAHIMARIEDATGLRMAQMVDIFAGPSTGAILNAALNVPHPSDPEMPKYRARHMVKFYEREGLRIFPTDSLRDFRALIHDFNNRTMKIRKLKSLLNHGHYDPGHLSWCLRELYGDTQLSDSIKSLIVPVYNIDGEQMDLVTEQDEDDDAPVHTQNNLSQAGGHAVWLKNMKIEKKRRPTPSITMHEAVMGSTAAPTFFPCHNFEVQYNDERGTRQITGVDGSIFDNPCISYHGAVRQHLADNDKPIMIQLGTGYTHKSIKKDDWNSYGGLGVVDPVNDLPLINILFHAPESALFESFYQEIGDDLFNFNKSLIAVQGQANAPSLQIDDATPKNITALRDFAYAIIEENMGNFETICDLLVRNYENIERNKREAEQDDRRFFGLLPGKKDDEG